MSPGTQISRDLNQGPVTRTLLAFAMPLLFSSFLQLVYNTTDMIVVGHFVGRDGLGAASIGGDVMHFVAFVSMGFSNAGQVIISQFTGAGMKEQVSRTVGTLFTFLGTAGLVFGLCGILLCDQLLGWINTPPEALSYARSYVMVCMSGLVFTYGYNIVSAILRGMGDSRHPFIFISISVCLNVVLDLVFVICFHWALFGVALATIISQAVSFITALAFLYRHRHNFGFAFRPRDFKPDESVLRPLLGLGLPMMLQSAAISFSMLFVNSWINSYGLVYSALTGIGNKLSLMANVINIALSTACSAMIGQAIGAERYERVKRIILVAQAVSGATALCMAVSVLTMPRLVFGIFTSDQDVLDTAMTYVPVALILFLGCGTRPAMNALVNGSGNFKLNLTVGILDGIVGRIGLAMLLGLTCHLGVYGFWYGSSLAGLVPALVGVVYYFSGKWRTRKYIIERARKRASVTP